MKLGFFSAAAGDHKMRQHERIDAKNFRFIVGFGDLLFS